MSFTLKELAGYIGAEIKGDSEYIITGLSGLNNATQSDISFIVAANYIPALESSSAGAVIIPTAMEANFKGNILYHADPYLAYAQLSAYFAPQRHYQEGIHPSAVIHDSSRIGENVSIAANVVIDPYCVIEEGVTIGANTVIQAGSSIGADTCLYSNISIGLNSVIGQRCIIHPGTVIGADGFGFAPRKDNEGLSWVKIEQIGNVVIGDDVEIGANTTIDRAALDSTRIGNGVKIDNQVQIAHNVELGDHTVLAGATSIAGSTRIGKRVRVGGLVGISGHLTIADDVTITARSMVIKSIKKAGAVMSSGTITEENRSWRKNVLRFQQLDEMYKRISALEKK